MSIYEANGLFIVALNRVCNGCRHAIQNPAIWQETFVSSVLRSILDENDEADANDGRPTLGLRKLDPLQIPPHEKKFLEAAKAEFWKGWLNPLKYDIYIDDYRLAIGNRSSCSSCNVFQ